MTHTPNLEPTHTAFDSALRVHYAHAQTHVSPQLRAQLAQRRNAALRGIPTTAPSRQPLRLAMAGLAAVCVLAAGLQIMQPTSEHLTDDALLQQTAFADTSGSTSLEEDPDFYAWLGTADVQQLALE